MTKWLEEVWNNQWVRGLAATLVGGFASAVPVVIVDPAHFNFFEGGAIKLLEVSAASAIVAVAAYLTKHPVPEWDGEERRTQ